MDTFRFAEMARHRRGKKKKDGEDHGWSGIDVDETREKRWCFRSARESEGRVPDMCRLCVHVDDLTGALVRAGPTV